MNRKQYYVYIMTNPKNTVLYTGITGNISRRIYEHKTEGAEGFIKKYNVKKLVYVEICNDPLTAITREKQIKGGSRAKKIALIEKENPNWNDISDQIN